MSVHDWVLPACIVIMTLSQVVAVLADRAHQRWHDVINGRLSRLEDLK